MANNYQVSANQLTPGTTVVIRGQLTFSRLAKLVEGAELARADAQRVQNGMQAIGVPHTSVNLAHAEVVYADPANPTAEEIFVNERRFISRKHPDNGQSYSIDNKSTKLPIVGTRNARNEVEQVILESDLAAGLQVTLVLRVYKPKNYSNCGLSLDLVVVEEPIRYYNPGVDQNELAARGIIFAAPPKQISGAESPAAQSAGAVSQQAYTNGLPPNTDPNTGLPAPAPASVAAVPATPPVMQQAPAAQPVQQLPVVQQPAPVAAPVETPEQELARLRQADAARQAAAANAGGASAFGAAPAAAADQESPWLPTPVAQGISYSG